MSDRLPGCADKLMPQVSFTPNAMGSYIRVNGLGNKYVLVLVNGKKMIGDIAGNVDLTRINMSKVKRIEVLDGAASALYGSDAIGGVINIITDENSMDNVAVSSDTRVSGKGQFSEGVNLDVTSKYLDSHTSYFHQEADSYQNNGKAVDADGKEYETIAPLFIGFNSNVINQRFDIKSAMNFSMYAGGSYSYKLTDRPDSHTDITGGSDYDMRSEGWRWEVGAKYKFGKHSLLLDLVNDNYHYGNLYQVAIKTYDVGDFVRNKFQKYYEAELKGVFHFYDKATAIIGADWRNYTLGVNFNGRFLSATYYPAYEDASGYGVINLNTTHTFTVGRMFKLVPSIGIDNIFDKTDHRIDTPSQKVALYSPGRMLVVGLKVNFAK